MRHWVKEINSYGTRQPGLSPEPSVLAKILTSLMTWLILFRFIQVNAENMEFIMRRPGLKAE